MNNRTLKIWQTNIPGLSDARLVDGVGVTIEDFRDLTMGQVKHIAAANEATILPQGGPDA